MRLIKQREYEMYKKTALVAVLSLTVLTGCATGAPDPLILQQATSTRLGLASTDEITLSNVVKAAPDALGGSTVTFDAVTAKGRKFGCQTRMLPNLNPLEKPTYTTFECSPK
jgi:hypothetical protein